MEWTEQATAIVPVQTTKKVKPVKVQKPVKTVKKSPVKKAQVRKANPSSRKATKGK
jgi:hypothetical protein